METSSHSIGVEQLKQLSRQLTGEESIDVSPLPGSGSSRKYYRLAAPDGRTTIGVVGTDREENRAFIALSRHFTSKGLPMAKVLAVSPDEMTYIVDDLGDVSLFELLADTTLIAKTIALLPAIQIGGHEGMDYNRCYPVAEMDRRSVMWDLNYFKYCFIKPAGLEFDEARLEDDFQRLATDLLADAPGGQEWGFMYRDFQSRNVMVVGNEPHFIDFQGGRRGPCQYDLVAFLWQARAGFAPEFRDRMIDVYLDSLAKIRAVDREAFKQSLRHFVLFRLMQVLGAYGFRGLIQNKVHFILSIAPALDSLAHELTERVADEYPTLRLVLTKLTALDAFKRKEKDGLTVTVNSFGFRKSGIPRDMSGNGGGFVFDCRSLPNPGRIDQYKPLTGRDKAVADYLEQFPEVEAFFNEASTMVTRAVDRYIERGFSDLNVNFGCTGGRHRSVYMAERMASLLAQRNDIHVTLNHTEHNIKQEIK